MNAPQARVSMGRKKRSQKVYKDFRGFLDYLEEKGKLLRVQKEVDIRFEIAAGIRKASDTDGPALLFENIKGFPGWKVAGGVFATQQHLTLALGLPAQADEESILKRYMECDEKQVAPKLVDTGPVKEVIIKGEDVDLTKLPIAIYSDLDAGPYLTAGVEIAKHPDTGIQNASMHRRMVLDKNRTSILAKGHQHLGMMITAAEEKGQGLGIATVLGADPVLAIASQIEAPFGVDETTIAGAFRGEPLEMVKCETIDVEVPANAEIVIEGVTVPKEKVLDGPFGEFPGNYITLVGEPLTETPVIKVTAITMRRNPIFQAMLTGSPLPMTENHFLKKWAHAAAAYREASKFAEVKAVNVPVGGTGQFHLVIAINKKSEEEPKDLLKTLLGTLRRPRRIVIVDDDINVYDHMEIEWALATRVQADKDIIIIPRGTSSFSKWGIDATMPIEDRKWYERIKVPGVEKVDYFK